MVTVENRPFVRLSKLDSTITRFFTGKWAKSYPMKNSSTFRDLVTLRNRTSMEPDMEPGGGRLDDLGLDEEMPRKRSTPNARVPIRIVEISIDGVAVSVLSGCGHLDLRMELTTENMSMLYRKVSTELKAGPEQKQSKKTPDESGALETETPGGDGPDQDDSSPEQDSSEISQTVPEPSGCKGITWIEKRKAWVLRYDDSIGQRHQKRFRAIDPSLDSSKQHAHEKALAWLVAYRRSSQEGALA